MNSIKLYRIIPYHKRMIVNSFALISTVFLTFYNQLVCPFLESRPFYEELLNLLVVFLIMVVMRELFFYFFTMDLSRPNVTGRLTKLYVLSWLSGGLIAMVLHEILYHNYNPSVILYLRPWPSDYPWHSHLKVLSGFWFLGAGLISQLELIVTEGMVRDYLIKNEKSPVDFSEYISRRITFGNFFYTFVPSSAMLIMVLRYALQDRLIPLAIAGEISYIGFFFVLVALLAARMYGNRLKKDTIVITDALIRIGEGDFNSQLWPARQDELGLISSRINEMTLGLKQRENLKKSFDHFVSPQIADRIMMEYDKGQDLRSHGEKKSVAVLMCDIRNFSPLSETMTPSEIVQMLNDYFDHMVKAIGEAGGVVDKFMGDAVMAVFGLTGDDENPSYSALKGAVAIRKELKKFNAKRSSEGKVTLENGVGIHYGEVVASFLGSSERLEFTVIGATVNVATRLEAQAKRPNPSIIFSKVVAEKVKDRVKCVKIGELELKGVGVQSLYSLARKGQNQNG